LQELDKEIYSIQQNTEFGEHSQTMWFPFSNTSSPHLCMPQCRRRHCWEHFVRILFSVVGRHVILWETLRNHSFASLAIKNLKICYLNIMSSYHQKLDRSFLVYKQTLHKKLQIYFSYFYFHN